MPRKISIKKKTPTLKKTSIKQKQKQSVIININDKIKRTRTPRIVRVASTGGSLGTTTIYTQPLQLPIYNSDENSLKTLNEGLTNAFVSLQNAIRSEKYNQPALNTQRNGQENFLSLDEVRLAGTTPLIPVPELTPIKPVPELTPVKSVQLSRKDIPIRHRIPTEQVINPSSGRPINVGGPTYNKLQAKGFKF